MGQLKSSLLCVADSVSAVGYSNRPPGSSLQPQLCMFAPPKLKFVMLFRSLAQLRASLLCVVDSLYFAWCSHCPSGTSV